MESKIIVWPSGNPNLDRRDQIKARVEFAKAKAETVAKEDELTKNEEPELSEEDFKEKAAKLTPKQIADTLQEVKALLEDKEEDISEEDRATLTEAFIAAVDMLNKQLQASAGIFTLCTEFTDGSETEFVHKCWGHPCGQNVKRRAKSLTPGAIIKNKRTDRSSATSEYVAGKYQFDYSPKDIGEAKHKYTKTRTSTKRWAAASLLLAIPAIIPGVKNPALKTYKHRTAQRKKAKSQYFKFKYAQES